MKHLDLPPKTNTGSSQKNTKKPPTKSPQKIKIGQSKYCQRCQKETDQFFEVPFDKYTTMKICESCKKI